MAYGEGGTLSEAKLSAKRYVPDHDAQFQTQVKTPYPGGGPDAPAVDVVADQLESWRQQVLQRLKWLDIELQAAQRTLHVLNSGLNDQDGAPEMVDTPDYG